jgi:hypothetical protein
MEALTNNRNSLLHIVDKVTEYSLEIKEWLSHNPVDGYRANHSENLNKILLMFEGMEESERDIPPFDYTNFNALIAWVMSADIEEWREETNERNKINWQTKFDKIKKIKELRIQHEFTDDSKEQLEK